MDESISDNSFYLNAVCSTPSALSNSDGLDDDLDFDPEISPEPVESKFDKTLAELEITKSMLKETLALLEHNKREGTNKSGIPDIYKDENNELFNVSISNLLLIKSELEAALELEREASVIEIYDDFTSDFTLLNETVESSDCSVNDTIINALNDKTLTKMEENVSRMANALPVIKSPPEHVKALLKVSHSPLMGIMLHKNVNFDICFEDKTQMEAAPSSSAQETPTNYGIKRKLKTTNLEFEKFHFKILSKDTEPPRKLSKSQDGGDIEEPIRDSCSDLTLQQNTFVEVQTDKTSHTIKEPVLYESEVVADDQKQRKRIEKSLSMCNMVSEQIVEAEHSEVSTREDLDFKHNEYCIENEMETPIVQSQVQIEKPKFYEKSLNLPEIPSPHDIFDNSEISAMEAIATQSNVDEINKLKFVDSSLNLSQIPLTPSEREMLSHDIFDNLEIKTIETIATQSKVNEIDKIKSFDSSLNLSQIPLPLDKEVHHELRMEKNDYSENEEIKVMVTERKEDGSLNLSQIPLPLDKEVHRELRLEKNDYLENEKSKVIVTERKEDETLKNKEDLNFRKTYLSSLRSVDMVPERSPIKKAVVEKLEQYPKTLKIILNSGTLNILKDVSNKIQHITYENKPICQSECFNTEPASGIENLLSPKREPIFKDDAKKQLLDCKVELIPIGNAAKLKFSPVIFDLEQSKVSEVPSPIRAARKRLPYVSNDPKENQDNCDPKWDILRLLETDEDRYKAVRLRWCNMTIPDPHADLTFRTKRHPTSRPQNSLLRNKNENSNSRNIPLNVFYEEIRQRIVRDSNRKMELLYKEDENTSQEMLGKHLCEQDEQFRRCRNMPRDNSEARRLYNRQMEESRYRKYYYENKKRLERESKYKLLAKLREIKAETEGFHTFYNGLSSTTALMISKTDLDNELMTDQMIHDYADFYKAPGASDNMDNSEKIPTLISRSIPSINTNNNFVPVINNNRYSVVIPDNINFTDDYNANFNFFAPQYSLNNYHYYPTSFGGNTGLQMYDNNFFDINRRHVHDVNPSMSSYEHSFHDHTYLPNYYINNCRTYRGPFS